MLKPIRLDPFFLLNGLAGINVEIAKHGNKQTKVTWKISTKEKQPNEKRRKKAGQKNKKQTVSNAKDRLAK